jgi:hypothetical protein
MKKRNVAAASSVPTDAEKAQSNVDYISMWELELVLRVVATTVALFSPLIFNWALGWLVSPGW